MLSDPEPKRSAIITAAETFHPRRSARGRRETLIFKRKFPGDTEGGAGGEGGEGEVPPSNPLLIRGGERRKRRVAHQGLSIPVS